MGARHLISVALFVSCSAASAVDCVAMAEMASDVAKLRDAGVPSATVEARLRSDVSAPEELGMAITVVRLVYRTRGTAEQLRAAVLAKRE
jgi:hypothetical protein